MWKRLSAVAVIACCAIALVAAVAQAATVRVAIRNIDYSRHTVTIHRGDSVTWRFVDPYVSHNVTSHGKLRFRSSSSKLTGTYSVRFTKAGTFRYVCTMHPNMRARVVVR